ncbi:atg-2 [Pristionchus pacificus]|uniref:Autophagy-related protein 2 n=1 Tax=Pristionchus pacificus TaxID=54126 RepID=A0A2A6BJL9_PRIPA|nr:atg-2 [Pristionchus pacificus]|eukprot:PDM66016.1 atg-2 [Pristionchus pacificus]
MHFFDFNISDHLHGRWCRFIIHRYLGHLLEKNLSLEQLSIDLSKGCVQIEQVMLNAQYINETMSSLNLPLRLVDGFIGSIRIKVPWSSLMADASEVDLSDVQLTFRGMEAFKLEDKDLVSCMVGSVVESLVSSMDLAQSFCKEEKDEGQWSEGSDDDSVHALSKVVDAVVSRFCCNIDDLILRVESDAAANCDMATAVEFKIEKLRFMDEQMKMCRQEGKSAETITSQPHGLSSVTNLNKYINLDGVSLYTDTFSKADLPVANDYGSPVTSMYLRREHKKSLQKAGSPHASMYMSTNLADSMMMSGIYQSCYSIQPNPSPSIDEFKSVRPEPTLISNPVKFAEIAGETTIVVRIKNSDMNAKEKLDSKFEFDIFSKGINILVTPSQVELIKHITGLLIPVDEKVSKKSVGGEPMANRDFDIVNRQLDDITTDYVPAGNALGRNGNWQGVEDFHSFQSISLKDDSQHRMASIRREQEKATTEANKRETAMISVKIGTILAFLTHDDPLSADSVALMERGPREAVDLLHVNAKRFFEKAAELKIFHAMPISSMQAAADDLYLKDHIRLIGSTVSVSYSVESAPNSGTRVSTKLSVANCDISEYLTAEATMTGVARHNPLFTFEREDGDQGSQFTVVMRKEETKTSTVIHLGKCCSELDMSISDRISHLLCPRPFFTQPTRSFKSAPAPSGLSEDLFSEVITKEAAPSSIEVNCANWTIDLKIPKVDLREGGDDRISHTVQNTHDEFLRLKLTSCKVLMPSKKSNGPTVVEITATKITGNFVGELSKLGCTDEETAFLYAGSKGKPVRIALEFDGSNKSLKARSNSGLLPTTVDDMTKSISADLIKNRPKKEGPFAQTHQSFTKSNATSDDENIVRAGSREEMATFARDCLEQADVTLRIDFPLLRLLIPNHQFLELLYNRLVNDFALWQPSAPVFKAKNTSLNINLDDCFKEVKSAVGHRLQLDSDDDDDMNEYSRERDRSTMKAQSHFFALNLEVMNGTMVMGTEVAPPSEDDPAQPAQVVAELGGTQMFVCYGFHGDLNQTFFHMTSTNVTVAQRNEPTIPKNVLNREFGSYEKSEVHLRSLAYGSHLREERRDDSLSIALHLVTSEDGRVKETTAAIALRLLELNLIPVKRMEEWWIMQLKDLFYLTDFDIPGYEMPVCNTYLHIHLDHAVLAHDHNRIIKGSPLKYKFVLGNVDINSTIVPSMKVNKFLFLFERVHLHMTNEDNEEENRTISYEDEPKIKGSNMVHILEIGLFQLELLFFNQLMAAEGEKRNCPLFELRCQNDQIKAWVCHDSLVTLINTMVEVAQSDLWKDERAVDVDGVLSPDEETHSVSSALTKSTVTTVKKGDSLPPGAERRLKRLVENACEDAPIPPSPSPYEGAEIGYAKEAVEEWAAHEDLAFDNNLLEDAMRDMSIGSGAGQNRSASFSTDEEFFMVEDIPGCGITSSSGEPRIRLIDPDNTAESGDYYYNYIPEHIPTSGDFRSDCIPLPADYPMPLIRYKLKDISIQLHIFAGNDLGTCPEAAKTYSAEEYRDGSGRGQSIAREARGGPFRDHSVSVVLELAKISFLHQLFDKYATSEHPRRTCAPMIAIRMVENHAQEGKLRVSMLPIRLNIDQDTLEFLEDFVQAVNTGLALPETAKLQLTNHPVIEVPEGIESSEPSPNPRPVPPPLLSPLPLKPTRSPSVVEDVFTPQMSKLRDLDDLDDFYGLGSSAPVVDLPSLTDFPPPPSTFPVPPPRPSRRDSRDETMTRKPSTNPFEDDLISEFMPERLSPFGSRALDAGQRGDTPPSADEDEFALSSPVRPSLFDMDAAQTQLALEELDQPSGDWASSSSIHFPPSSAASHRVDDLLSRSTMEGSMYGGGLGQRIEDDEDDDEPITDEPFLTSDDRFQVETSVPNEDTEGEEERQGEDEDDHDTICSEAPRRMSTSESEEKIRGTTFFKEFIFSPDCTIYIDYHGKNKYNMERSGAVLGVLRGIGQLNRTEINLKSFEHRNGLLGMGRCATHAFTEWQENIMANIPGVLSSVGPISPLVQIGKGICDLFWMPVSEMRKEDGHVVKGLQRGTSSFGFSTAAAVVDLAQRLVGVVQMTPDHPSLNNRNRRPVNQRVHTPQDVRHGMQLAYDLIANGVQQTREDLELATQEDRASGRSSMRSVLRYATPAILRPFVITSQIGYHLLGGLKNQLRPDQFHDEQHKWRNERDRAGTGGNN